MKISCIIVEDEPLAAERLQNYVKKLPFLHLSGTFDNALDALVFLKSQSVDLLFLDINLGDFSGIRLLETANLKSRVILTTAYHEYAIKGFDLKVSDYLLKPFTFERFVQAVERVQEYFTKQEPPQPIKFIFVKTEYRLEKIMFDELLFIEGKGDYRQIHTKTRKIMTLQTFTDFEQDIPPAIVCRVHKSYMVAIDKIDSIEKDRIRIQNTLIPISDSYRQGFYELIHQSIK
ncbi:LytTR family DNA-binding domain-containing protein [Emticicia sp. 21SJ11W-3]|uniref:LytR/AlgR family response regulator transcription factor n=1 Tax=Emticicia sp. 21SJ11W-3 TaxID=2916755 RepID=UPI00209D644A|nr:LytTR family DNA-binding domain-containing protein [Emticicia sp. 21SJ11W-3]UTA67101.1 LytTR family DNA-binding domain-containing protein [Emticicia sp. 21SJ11W-3]